MCSQVFACSVNIRVPDWWRGDNLGLTGQQSIFAAWPDRARSCVGVISMRQHLLYALVLVCAISRKAVVQAHMQCILVMLWAAEGTIVFNMHVCATRFMIGNSATCKDPSPVLYLHHF